MEHSLQSIGRWWRHLLLLEKISCLQEKIHQVNSTTAGKKLKNLNNLFRSDCFLMPADKQQQRRLTKLELLNEKKTIFF